MSAASPLEATAGGLRTAASWRARLHHGEVRLDPHRNGLNLLRLLLASSVLFAHGFYISGDGIGPHLAGDNVGGWAVYGFFAISGYLITGSRFNKPFWEYLLHRVARIFPAFLVCLVLIAFAFAPVGYLRQHGSLDGFLTTPTTPFSYVVSNAGLRVSAYGVAHTPGPVPYPEVWNGSLWTLYYEFLCYLIIGVVAGFAIVRRSPVPLAIAWFLSVALHVGMGRVPVALLGNGDIVLLAKLLPFFLAGALLFQVRKRLVLTWPAALLAVLASLVLIWLGHGWGQQVASLLLAYAVLWLGAVMPCPELIRRNDISYGVYIYAFPVQQLLALYGAYTWNLALFDVVAAIATVPLAMASWVVVERPLMRLARRTRSRRTADATPVEEVRLADSTWDETPTAHAAPTAPAEPPAR